MCLCLVSYSVKVQSRIKIIHLIAYGLMANWTVWMRFWCQLNCSLGCTAALWMFMVDKGWMDGRITEWVSLFAPLKLDDCLFCVWTVNWTSFHVALSHLSPQTSRTHDYWPFRLCCSNNMMETSILPAYIAIAK